MKVRVTLLAVLLPIGLSGVAGAARHTISVATDGSFSPRITTIQDGDTVEWEFAHRGDAVARVDFASPAEEMCGAWRPYDPQDLNEFTGPMPQAHSGIFVLGPTEEGLLATRDPSTGAYTVTSGGPRHATLDWTWSNPNITGVYIRLDWDEVHRGPGDFDFGDLDREVEKAVANGKLYSLAFRAGFHGTPEWIFDDEATGGHAVEALTFRDGPSHPHPDSCGSWMTLGSPADENYRKWYNELLAAAGDHLLAKSAWFRSLAYIKPGGLNLFTHENRLPNRCEQLGECEDWVCNSDVWFEQGDYSAAALFEYFREQTAVIAEHFPGKSMSYMLIHGGFVTVEIPSISLPDGSTVPGITFSSPDQVRRIIADGKADHAPRFVVQHNGLGPKPQYLDAKAAPCTDEGLHPKPQARWKDPLTCPSQHVIEAGLDWSVTGFQTQNPLKAVATGADLESTLENLWDNSDAVFLEIYEGLLLEIEHEAPGAVLPSGKTLGDWDLKLHRRRAKRWPSLPEPSPLKYEFTFERTQNKGTQHFYFVHPHKCEVDGAVNWGEVRIEEP